jgi:hypothetical protein
MGSELRRPRRAAIGEWLRIALAITAKDVADALRNRSILSTLFGVAIILVSYKYLPALTSRGDSLVIEAPGTPELVAALKVAPEYEEIHVVPSLDALREAVADHDTVTLGVVLPATLPAAGGGPLRVDGYVQYWASAAGARQAAALFEGRLTELLGTPVTVDTAGHRVYPPEGQTGGLLLLGAFSIILAILMTGLSVTPHLMLEERRTRTLDALLVSPVTMAQYVVGKVGAGMAYGALAGLLGLASYAALVVHWGWAILAALAGAAFTVPLGLLLGSAIRDRQQLAVWVWVLVLPLVTSVFLAEEAEGLGLPGPLAAVLRWMPTSAVARALQAAFARPTPPGGYWAAIGLALGCAAVLLTAVVRLSSTQAKRGA